MKQYLSSLDTNFWTIDTATTQQTIAAFFLLESAPCIQTVEAHVFQALDTFPKLRSRVTEGDELKWDEYQQFSIKDHVRFNHCPEVVSLSGLLERCARTFSDGLDRSKPLWRVELFSNRLLGEETDSAQSTVAGGLLLLHHAFCDGLGGLELLDAFCTNHPQGAPATLGRTRKAESRSRVRASWKTIGKLVADALSKKKQGPLNGQNSAERQILVWDLPLSALQQLKRQFGASLNDVLLGIVATAVRNYHLQLGHTPEDMHVVMPVSLRKLAERWNLGNKLTGVGVTLPSSRIDPREQLRCISEHIRILKDDGSIRAYELLANLTAKLPHALRLRVCEAAARRTNFICTNVIAAKRLRYLGGSQIVGTYGLAALMRGHGVAFAFTRYAEKMCLSLVSDPNIIPQPHMLQQFIIDAFQELHTEAA